MNINLSPTIENEYLRLTPLKLENYEKLISIGAQDKLVQYSPSDMYTSDSLKNYAALALE